MTEPDDLTAKLATTTDVIATRLDTLLNRVDAVPDDTPGVAELRADADSLRPMVEVLERLGRDPANPVPPVSELPPAVLPPPGLGPLPDMPLPSARADR